MHLNVRPFQIYLGSSFFNVVDSAFPIPF